MLTHHFNSDSSEITLAYKLKEYLIGIRAILIQPLQWFSSQIAKRIVLVGVIVLIASLLIFAIPLSLFLAIYLLFKNREIKNAIKQVPNLPIGELQKIHSILENSAKEITEKLQTMENSDMQKIPLKLKLIFFPLKIVFAPFLWTLGYSLKTSWEFKKAVKEQLRIDFINIEEALETNTPISF